MIFLSNDLIFYLFYQTIWEGYIIKKIITSDKIFYEVFYISGDSEIREGQFDNRIDALIRAHDLEKGQTEYGVKEINKSKH